MPAYRPAVDPQQDLGLPVYRVTGKYNLPREQRSWGFDKVAADECFDNYSWCEKSPLAQILACPIRYVCLAVF